MNELLNLELLGLPPTVNTLYRSMSNGQRYKTEKAREYQEEVSWLMRQAWGDRPPYSQSVAVWIYFTSKGRRKWDIDNRVKALQDCLEMSGVIEDDAQIDMLTVMRKAGDQYRTQIAIITMDSVQEFLKNEKRKSFCARGI